MFTVLDLWAITELELPHVRDLKLPSYILFTHLDNNILIYNMKGASEETVVETQKKKKLGK